MLISVRLKFDNKFMKLENGLAILELQSGVVSSHIIKMGPNFVYMLKNGMSLLYEFHAKQ